MPMPELDTTALVTLEQALRALKKNEPGEQEALILECINRASAVCERYTRRKLASRLYTLARPHGDPYGRELLLFPEYPINSVTTIREYSYDMQAYTDLTTNDWELDDDGSNGMIRCIYGTWPHRSQIKLTLDAGVGWGGSAFDVSEVPPDLAEACLFIVGDIYTMIQAKQFRQLTRAIESITMVYDTSEIPKEAKVRLDMHTREGITGFA